MVRIKIALPALLVAATAFAAGCASVDASTQKSSAAPAKPAAAAQQDEIEVGYITGSRLPRKATQNTQGVKQSAPAEWQRYQPTAPLKGD